jgi:uncharacterized protein HemX
MSDRTTPEQKPSSPKKQKVSLNTKKTFKQIRSRTLFTILLIMGLAAYQYVTMNRIEQNNRDFQIRLAQQIDSSNQKQLAKIDSVINIQKQSNQSILTAQKQSEQRIRSSIREQIDSK